jgi:hypothetical protein
VFVRVIFWPVDPAPPVYIHFRRGSLNKTVPDNLVLLETLR